jgi:pyruvate-ferredoxin/flavodoxin oxidoreductase
MTYGNIYVASVAFGAKDTQTVKAIIDAESYRGPSLVIAYSHCIATDTTSPSALSNRSSRSTAATGRCTASTRAVARRAKTRSRWIRRRQRSVLEQYMRNETRFRIVQQQDPERLQGTLGDGADARHASVSPN